MPLKAILTADEHEALGDATKGLYREEGDGFILDVEGADALPSTKTLRSTLDRQKAELAKTKKFVSELEAKLAKYPQDFTPEQWEELTALREKLDDGDHGDGGKDTKDKRQSLITMYEQRLANQKKQSDTDKAKLEKERDEYKARWRNALVGQALTKSLVEANVRPELMEAAMTMHERNATVDDDGDVLIRTADEGEVSVEKFVSNWIASDKGKAFVAMPKGGGAGDQGSDRRGTDRQKGPNPWAKETYNVTEQGRIFKADPDRAKKLAAEAKVPLFPGMPVAAA